MPRAVPAARPSSPSQQPRGTIDYAMSSDPGPGGVGPGREGTAGPGGLRRRLGRLTVDTAPLRVPEFRRLWSAGVVAVVGSQFTVVAVPQQLFQLTGSSGYVGLSGLFALVPLIVFGLWGGAVADRVDRRRLVLLTTTGIGATSVLFGLLAVTHTARVWSVLLLLAVQTAFTAVNQPARSAMIPRLVGPELVASANALNTTVFAVGVIAGPLLAGLLLPLTGVTLLYLVDAVGLAGALVVLRGLPSARPDRAAAGGTIGGAGGLRDVVDGFRYLSTQRILLASFVVDVIAMVAGMPRALFPQMAQQTFGGPPAGGTALGLLNAGVGIGAVVGGLTSGWIGRVDRMGRAVVVAVAVWGAAMVGFGLTGSLVLAVAFLAIGGLADNASSILRSTILQTATTDAMRGRLQGVFTVVVAGGPRLGDLVHGGIGQLTSTRFAATGGGVAVLGLLGLALVPLWPFWLYDRRTTGPGGPARTGRPAPSSAH